MCGISGFYSPSPQSIDFLQSKARILHETQAHRGPDDFGVHIDRDTGLVLAHRRLSIIDLSAAGHQPMESASGRYSIVFNGEIYNFQDLRTDLLALGHVFKGHSDTEVMLAAFEEWGVQKTLGKINGMFAFALFDSKDRKITFARDRMGKKPLYVGWGADGFYFTSEMKAVLAALPERPAMNERVAETYFWWRYVPEPLCIYEGFSKIPPGHFWQVHLDALRAPHDIAQEVKPFWFWSDTVNAPKLEYDGEDVLKRLDTTLRTAVECRMIADVPLGAFLSGGVDSSLVVALMQAVSTQPVRTYSVAFEEKEVNESEIAKSVAKHLGTDHTEFCVTAQDAIAAVDAVNDIYDEPLADPSSIPVYLMCQKARHSMTVAFSGDGGDETFGGYGQYAKARMLHKIPFFMRHGAKFFLSFLLANDPKILKLKSILNSDNSRQLSSFFLSYWQSAPDILVREQGRLEPLLDQIEQIVSGQSLSRQMMAFDSVMFLPGMVLPKVDRASMASSMEIRSPLLDQNVVELGWRLPDIWRENKRALRALLKRYVPDDIVNRPKHPFLIPHGEWMRGALRDWGEELLSPDNLARHGLLDAAHVTRLWKEHQSGAHNHQDVLWTILQFQNWYKRWM